MPFNISKRSAAEITKTSPLKMVSPIIRKYAEHRQKRTKKSNVLNLSEKPKSQALKAILPNSNENEIISVEPELIGSVNPSGPSTFTTNVLPEEISQPVQEICAIARLAAKDSKNKVRRMATTKRAKTRKRSGSSGATAAAAKKKIKQEKHYELACNMLRPEPAVVVNSKEQAFAENYFKRVKSTFAETNEDIFLQFCTKLEELEKTDMNVVKFYQELKQLFAGHNDLLDDFIPFLTAEQALTCGVFMEHFVSTKMMDFLNLVDIQFAKSNSNQVKKIHNAFEKVLALPEIDMKQMCSVILPLLKGNAVLTDFFLDLIPSSRPPDPLPIDFEDLDDYGMSDESDGKRKDYWEKIELPEMPDPYGGLKCTCSCHDSGDGKFQARVQHCNPCSKLFINGNIFIQMGESFRRAKLTFQDYDMAFHRQRLCSKLIPDHTKKRNCCFSPKSGSDGHRSDPDDDNKAKGGLCLITPRSCKFLKPESEVREQNGRGSKKSLKFVDECKNKIKTEHIEILSPTCDGKDFDLKKSLKRIDGCNVSSSPGIVKVENKSNIAERGNDVSSSNTVIFINDSEAQSLKKNDLPIKNTMTCSNLTRNNMREKVELDKFSSKSETLKLDSVEKSPSCDRVKRIKLDEEGVEGSKRSRQRLSKEMPLYSLYSHCMELKRISGFVPTEADTIKFITAPEFESENDKSEKEKNNVLEKLLNKDDIENNVNAKKDVYLQCTANSEESTTVETIRITPKLRKPDPEPFKENEILNEETPIVVIVQNLSDYSDRKSPPVISLPESNKIPSNINPLLNAMEDEALHKLNETNELNSDSIIIDIQPWTLDEDRIILRTLQSEKYCEETFTKINIALPTRSIDDIKQRFQELLSIICKMNDPSES